MAPLSYYTPSRRFSGVDFSFYELINIMVILWVTLLYTPRTVGGGLDWIDSFVCTSSSRSCREDRSLICTMWTCTMYHVDLYHVQIPDMYHVQDLYHVICTMWTCTMYRICTMYRSLICCTVICTMYRSLACIMVWSSSLSSCCRGWEPYIYIYIYILNDLDLQVDLESWSDAWHGRGAPFTFGGL